MKGILSVLVGLVFAGILMVFGITQDVPRGQISGRVTMKENGRGLARARVVLTSVGDLSDSITEPRVIRTREDGSFSARSIPAGQYRVEVSAKAHSIKRKIVAIEEGKVTTEDLPLAPNEPYLQVYQSQRVWTPSETPQVELHGFVPDASVQISGYRLNPTELAKVSNVRDVLEQLARPNDNSSNFQTTPISARVLYFRQELKSKDAEGVIIEPLHLKPLPVGLYWLQCLAAGRKASAFLNVSQIALVTKSTSASTLCYVTDIVSGQPIDGAEIQKIKGSKLALCGKTNADGLLTVPGTSASFVAIQHDSVAIGGTLEDHQDDQSVRFFTYTDRPIYRPGDTVRFKSIIRRTVNGDFGPPPRGSAEVELKDGDDSLIEKKSLVLSSHGAISGDFRINSEAKPGYFTLVIKSQGGSDRQTLNLSAYRKPDYEVKIDPTKPIFFIGDRVSVAVSCTYYYGGPVVGAKVSGDIYRSPTWDNSNSDDPDAEPDVSEENSDGFRGGDYQAKVEGVTDAKGQMRLEFDTRAAKDPDDYPTDFDFNLALSVADESGKAVDASAVIKVLRGAVALTVKPDNYWYRSGDVVHVDLSAQSVGLSPTPLVAQVFDVVAGTETWAYRKYQFKEIARYSASSDSAGKAKLSIPSAPGNFVIKVSTKDSNGRMIRRALSLYVEGIATNSPRDAKFSLLLDKPHHEIGDTVRVRLATENPGGYALLTVEADRIIKQQLVYMDHSCVVVNFPVASSFAPNAYISAVYIRSKTYAEATKSLVVNRVDRRMTVQIETDKSEYKPGSPIHVKIHTKGIDGNPVAADVSVGVVDESIYAIQKDQTNIYQSLYPHRYNQVRTSYSFPEIYLDGGDKGGPAIPLRRKFQDTAFWQPSVETDTNGNAQLSFTLPDNLTTWRISAIGCSDSTAVGQSTLKFKARKNVMVRFDLPNFLVEGDEQRIVVALTNDTDKAADINLRATVDGASIAEVVPKSIHIEAHTPYALPLTVKAIKSGTLKFTARAWTNTGESDGVEQTIPCHPHGTDTIDTQNGIVHGLAMVSIIKNTQADPNVGGLTVTVTPSISATLAPSLQTLIGFPYGCVEQTMSRFLPSILVSKTLKKIGFSNKKLESDVPKIVVDGFARLGKMQHANGGWGWWEYDETDPFMTALVLEGIAEAREAGYPARFIKVKAAMKWAARHLTSPEDKKETLRDRLYLAYALGKVGDQKAANLFANSVKTTDSIFATKSRSDECALAARLFHSLHRFAERDALLRALEASAIIDGPYARWAENQYAWGEESTAFALAAIQEGEPSNPQVEMAIRYLLRQRTSEGWSSTRATSYVLKALCAYLERSQDHPEAATISILLNGKTLKSFSIKSGVESALMQVQVPVIDLRPGENRVEIRSTGKSGILYTAQTKQCIRSESLAAMPAGGLSVSRSYYRLESRRMEDGTQRLLPSEKPVTTVNSGDVIQCRLTITSDQDREFMLIEDRTPSNVRITEREDPGLDDSWDYWWSRTVVLDDRAAFFSRRIPKGTSKITYMFRAEGSGTSQALPALVSNMYDPSRRASSAENLLTVQK